MQVRMLEGGLFGSRNYREWHFCGPKEAIGHQGVASTEDSKGITGFSRTHGVSSQVC